MSEKDEPKFSADDRPRWSEMMREIALGGLATYFMTEDAVRGYLKEMRLPKEVAGAVLDGISKKKDDFYGLLVKEFGKVLAKVDISKEVSKFLELHKVNISVSFEPKDGTVVTKEVVKNEAEREKSS
jgi:hypothetical protein